MTALQGRCIPALLTHVSMSLAPPCSDCHHEEYFKIPGILLQYIKGYNLSTGLASSVPMEAWGRTVQLTVYGAKMVNDCGVINQDCQPRKVLVQHSILQPFLVDFAQCSVREDYGSDNEFAYRANSTNNQGAIDAVMAQKLEKEEGFKLGIRYQEMKCNYKPDT